MVATASNPHVRHRPPIMATSTISEQAGAQPVKRDARIDSIDVLRGFALLGILLLNILAFGLHSAGYFNPLIATGDTETSRLLNLWTWASVSVLFEGAMRCLFSILFGAGVVLFATRRENSAGWLHYKRHFWLLLFGFVDAFILLWNGDILITYALAGAILYLFRSYSPRTLLITAAVLTLLMSTLFGGLARYGLTQAKMADDINLRAVWTEFDADNNPSVEDYESQLSERRESYRSAFVWTSRYMAEYLGVVALVLMPDALVMMLLGMAFFKLGILDGSWPRRWYMWLVTLGFSVGLVANLWELQVAFAGQFDTLSTFPFLSPTYHIGRVGMALGYLGTVMLVCKSGTFQRLRGALAAVGRMALTNYLMHSVICLVIFTGLGFSLVGTLERWQLYPIVVAIWIFQLWFSQWWLARYRFGPGEWLWRALTYGRRP